MTADSTVSEISIGRHRFGIEVDVRDHEALDEIPFASWSRMADSVRMVKLPACQFGFFLSFEAHDFAANLGRYG